jgi:hypothetical protein
MALDRDFVYFDGDNFKSITKIADTLDDATINLLGHSADSQVDNELFPFADQLPLIEINLITATSAALYYALSKWYAQKNNAEKSTFYDTQYTNEVDKLTKKLAASATGRTQRVSASIAYDTESELFSQQLK